MSVHTLFAALNARAPATPILIGDQASWNASELLAEISSLESLLADCRTLAVLADNSPAWIAADLAALRSGWIHLPLPTFFSPTQMLHALDLSGADAILTDQPERVAALDAGFAINARWNELAVMRRTATAVALPAGTAKISFTSGSTGQPKGACLSVAGLLDTAQAVAARLADLPLERHLAALPLSLLLENTAGIYAALLNDATVHLPGLATLGWKGMSGFDPAQLQGCALRCQANSLILVPELLKAWSLFLAGTGQTAPESLIFAAVGGARVAADAIGSARSLGIPAYQGYGLTECGSVVSINRPGDDADGVGRPLDHVRLRVDGEEIRIAARAFLGYIGQPNVRPGDEFATGDLGRIDAHGHIHLSGRRKNLLITSYGRNIAPEWVEAALLAQPAVAQAIVVGDARPWLSALLVPTRGAEPSHLDAAVARANAALPDYARIGGWIAADPFTLQNGQATGNGRPVRSAVLSHYTPQLETLYKETTHVLL